MVKPRLRGREPVLALQQLERRVVERPHALIGARGRQDCAQSRERESEAKSSFPITFFRRFPRIARLPVRGRLLTRSLTCFDERRGRTEEG